MGYCDSIPPIPIVTHLAMFKSFGKMKFHIIYNIFTLLVPSLSSVKRKLKNSPQAQCQKITYSNESSMNLKKRYDQRGLLAERS